MKSGWANWFGSVQRRPLAQFDTGLIYEQLCLNTPCQKKPPPIPVCLDACTVKSRTVGHNEHMYYSNSGGGGGDSVADEQINPTKCLLHEEKETIFKLDDTQSETNSVQLKQMHSLPFTNSVKYRTAVVRLHLFHFETLHLFASFGLVHVLLFYLCFLLLAFVSGHHHSHHPVSVGGSSFPMSTMFTHTITHSQAPPHTQRQHCDYQSKHCPLLIQQQSVIYSKLGQFIDFVTQVQSLSVMENDRSLLKAVTFQKTRGATLLEIDALQLVKGHQSSCTMNEEGSKCAYFVQATH